MSVIKWQKVIMLGDSITRRSFSSEGCWGILLADFLQRKCDVLNRGFSGYNVRWCRLLLPQLVTKENASEIAAITIFLGANDSNDFESNPRQHVPLAEYCDGLTDMVQYLMSVGINHEKIILINPPAFVASKWEKECIKKDRPLSKTNSTTGEYAKACIEVGQKCGVEVVDLYGQMMKVPEWENMLIDGLHLSRTGSQFLFQLLCPIIEKLTANLPMMFPAWDEVDVNDPVSSLVKT